MFTVIDAATGQVQSQFRDAERASDLCIALNQEACRFNLHKAFSVRVVR